MHRFTNSFLIHVPQGFTLEVDLATEDSAGFMVCGEEDYDDEEEEEEEEDNDDYDDEADDNVGTAAVGPAADTYHSSLRKGGTSAAAARYAASGKRRLSQPVLYTQKTAHAFSYLAYRRSSEGTLHTVEKVAIYS